MFEEKDNLEALQALLGDVSWIHYRESPSVHKGLDIVARVNGALVGLGVAIMDTSPRYRVGVQRQRERIAGMDWSRWRIHPLPRKRILGIVAFVQAREGGELLTQDESAEWEQICEQERKEETKRTRERRDNQQRQELLELRRLQAKYANTRTIKLVAHVGVDVEHFVGERILFQVENVRGHKQCASGRCNRRNWPVRGTVEQIGNGGVRLGVRVMGQLVYFDVDKDGKMEQEIDVTEGGNGEQTTT